MSKSRQRLLEISDLLLDVSKQIRALLSGADTRPDQMSIWREKAAELKHYASELVCISSAVRQQDESIVVLKDSINYLSPGPCKNGLIVDGKLINTEEENANRDDVAALESALTVVSAAFGIDKMSESQIDKAIQDAGVDPEALVERIEKKIRKQVN